MTNRRLLNIFFLSLVFSIPSFAQQAADSLGVRELLSKADALVKVYDFSASEQLYDEALRMETDTLNIPNIVAKKVAAENGVSMMEYVAEPSVVARGRFSKEDFFLYYPLADSTWVPAPNELDSTGVIYSPRGADQIVWSANGSEILTSFKKDSTWTLPAPLSENTSSEGSEIFPILSQDGNKLYFSSNALSGVGGYDLYVCEKDPSTHQWGSPTNMGFPFSSPSDDFLFVDGLDEKYSAFASNRDCSADSVDVYILSYDPLLVRNRIDDPVSLCSLAALTPKSDAVRENTSADVALEDEAGIKKYADKMEQIRILRDTISTSNRKLNELRVEYATLDDLDARADLTTKIIAMEKELPYIENALSKALSELQTIEMEFLFKGVIIDPEKIMERSAEPRKEEEYVFKKALYGTLPPIVFEQEQEQ